MRIASLVSLTAITVGLSSIPTAQAWGAAGHEIVATIAQIYLHPSVLPRICAILNYTSTDPTEPQCHLAPIATWADRIRYLPQFRWTAPLHYIGAVGDHPSETCQFPGERGWAGKKGMNVLGALRNVTSVLEEPAPLKDPLANEALKFLVHFMGDMHMPLHLTGRDRGGNGDKVLFDGRVTNLHSLWDSLLIAQRLRTIPRNYTLPLPYPQIEYVLRGTIYDPYVRRVMYEGILGTWKDEIDSWLVCPTKDLGSDSSATSWLGTFLPGWQSVLSAFWTGERGDEADDDVFCPYHWAAPIHRLNCDLVWPKALDEPPYSQFLPPSDAPYPAPHSHDSPEAELAQFDNDGNFVAGPGIVHKRKAPYLELDTPEYAGIIKETWVVEKLLAQGGIRLAGTLNYLFAEEEGRALFVRRHDELRI